MKIKICSKKGCYSPAFSKGLCKYHMPKKVIKQKSDRIIAIPKILGPETQYFSEQDMFLDVWVNNVDKNGICYSFISGNALYISDHKYYSFFAHVLNKKDFPLFRLYERNIALLTPYEHLLYDNGSLKERIAYTQGKWSLLVDLRDRLYKEYLSYDPSATKMLKTII